MAAFYGTVEGNRGTASRTGSKDSGTLDELKAKLEG